MLVELAETFSAEMIRCCLNSISKMASALFRIPVHESVHLRSMSREKDKVKNVAEFKLKMMLNFLPNERATGRCRNYTPGGQKGSKAYDVACSLLEGSTNTGAKEYFVAWLRE
jgi:hypothetical protein